MKYYIYKHGDYGFETLVKKLSGIQFQRLRLCRMAGTFSSFSTAKSGERMASMCRKLNYFTKSGVIDGFCIVVIQVMLHFTGS